MSFGFSIGDFLALTQLASNVVSGARRACGAHNELTREVNSLHIVLRQLSREVSKPKSILNSENAERKAELATLVEHCHKVLKVLDDILKKYNGLPDEKRRVTKLWKRVQFGNGEMQDLSKIRLELSTHTNIITMFLNLSAAGSLGKVEEHMNSHGEELKAKEFRRELVKEGYSSTVLSKYKTLIRGYVKELGDRGALDELSLEDIEEDTSDNAPDIFHENLVSEERKASPQEESTADSTDSTLAVHNEVLVDDAVQHSWVEIRKSYTPSTDEEVTEPYDRAPSQQTHDPYVEGERSDDDKPFSSWSSSWVTKTGNKEGESDATTNKSIDLGGIGALRTATTAPGSPVFITDNSKGPGTGVHIWDSALPFPPTSLAPSHELNLISLVLDTSIIPLCQQFARSQDTDSRRQHRRRLSNLRALIRKLVLRRLDAVDSLVSVTGEYVYQSRNSEAVLKKRNLLQRTEAVLENLHNLYHKGVYMDFSLYLSHNYLASSRPEDRDYGTTYPSRERENTPSRDPPKDSTHWSPVLAPNTSQNNLRQHEVSF
ncbi:uncharacterized protein LY89DRAFT_720429 [Mollisia scopiformis]|uniref:Fungal N-terminal domain-containing protein n=1 Tax=Mollisia scopiformis TaxID=149040 RepID=A0A194X4B4_MOLSC|nr:uncharacterized protein LY89DRAFT_720429 [Mollisia scopiformis]KUJ15015.1 hypothetical protein LY89DRAFT_720429 [Mollisia scopiformis]